MSPPTPVSVRKAMKIWAQDIDLLDTSQFNNVSCYLDTVKNKLVQLEQANKSLTRGESHSYW